MDWTALLLSHWQVKLVSITLIVAYVIDAKQLKVPNWITFPLAISGVAYWTIAQGWTGLGFSLLGLAAGLATLLPLYAFGGMGAGDVKLMAGAGAWVGMGLITQSFIVIALVGGLMAAVMILVSGRWRHHLRMAGVILGDVLRLRSATGCFDRATERKPTMTLLPYGIPVCIGAIGTFIQQGVLF